MTGQDEQRDAMAAVGNDLQTIYQCSVPHARDVDRIRGRLHAMTVSRDIYGQYSCNDSETPTSQRSGTRHLCREYVLRQEPQGGRSTMQTMMMQSQSGPVLRILNRLKTAENKQKPSSSVSGLQDTTSLTMNFSTVPLGKKYDKEVPEGSYVCIYLSIEYRTHT